MDPMDLIIRRSDRYTDPFGDVFTVSNSDRDELGRLVLHAPTPTRRYEQWTVVFAGIGVAVPPHPRTRYDSAPEAAAAVMAIRADSPALVVDHTGLTGAERTVLDIATEHIETEKFDALGQRMNAIHNLLGCSDTRWAQLLRHLLDRPAAHAYAPETVNTYRARINLDPIKATTAA